jgi:hypothetical protein
VKQLAQWHYLDKNPSHYEEDHLILLELGVAPRPTRNLWPEPWPQAHRSDENAWKKELCNGPLTLRQAQKLELAYKSARQAHFPGRRHPRLPSSERIATKGAAMAMRRWQTTKSRSAFIFAAGSVVGFFLTLFVPVVSDWKNNADQRKLEKQIAITNQRLQTLNRVSTEKTEKLGRQVEITRLLFDHYFGKPAGEQTAVVSYLRFQFPTDLGRKSLQAILNQGAHRSIRTKITRSVASVQQVGQTSLNRAVKQERLGFVALIRRDLIRARTAFVAAYRAYPTYHNVDEISHRVLSQKRFETYSQRRLLKLALSEILTKYSWGIPPALLPHLQATLKGL